MGSYSLEGAHGQAWGLRMTSRRFFLKGLAASPTVAVTLSEQVKMQAAGLGIPPLGGFQSPGVLPPSAAPLKFLSFRDWLPTGIAAAKQEAQYISYIDADLVERRLPLVTKVRLQRARNYERILADKQTWFEKQIKQFGFVDWWG